MTTLIFKQICVGMFEKHVPATPKKMGGLHRQEARRPFDHHGWSLLTTNNNYRWVCDEGVGWKWGCKGNGVASINPIYYWASECNKEVWWKASLAAPCLLQVWLQCWDASGGVDRALHLRSRGLGFNSRCWSLARSIILAPCT